MHVYARARERAFSDVCVKENSQIRGVCVCERELSDQGCVCVMVFGPDDFNATETPELAFSMVKPCANISRSPIGMHSQTQLPGEERGSGRVD